MSYLTPVEFERILKRVFYEDDIGRNLDYVGGHRWRTKPYDSGSLTVGPTATVSTISVSGIGHQLGYLFHESNGVEARRAFHEFNIDGQGFQYADRHGYGDVACSFGWGLTTEGWHLNSIRIARWDTVNNVYSVMNHFLPPRMYFRTSWAGRIRNEDPTLSSTQHARLMYNLFVSSRRILCKLPRYDDAGKLRKLAGSKELIHPLVVERLGYFEDEALHPYREFLEDLPNEYDTTLTLPDGTKVKSCSPKKSKIVLSLFVPDDWSFERAIGKIKVEKRLE